ncbi:Alpha-1,6-mannosylglycoprotein 6-beta-N-acetylglucosaminyltransferase A [Takifugu flavidus]|uniref:alpha-1,6-mannosyl-glycoprotein 6-beta-N-acetylglucosaminyltransferase n=1 Tax=Takifugu flavidus TaxID=433684 RepID=A0A5C6PNX6_9TELE|nr:Alpha-1,6-mannosylglycoprotein 6-beta-N-acetylglucosaminyltransferase A [Takifugu flavidus]
MCAGEGSGIMKPLSLERTFSISLFICFIWCLGLSYFTLSNNEQEAARFGHQNSWTKKQVEASGAEASSKPLWGRYEEEVNVLRSKSKMKDDLISRLNSDKLQLEQEVVGLKERLSKKAEKQVKSGPLMHNYEGEFKALKIQMEAEENKTEKMEETIKGLLSNKLQLEQEVAHLKELLVQKAEEHTNKDKINEDKDCPLPPMDGYPECLGKLKWMKEGWTSDPCYIINGVNGSLCSILIYLSETAQDTRRLLSQVVKEAESMVDAALPHLDPVDTEPTRAGHAPSMRSKFPQDIPSVPGPSGIVTDEIGIARSAFNGGPLGELVQWSDLVSTLHILGHHLHLSASITDLKIFLGGLKSGCPSMPTLEPNLIYTDILGLQQMQKALPNIWSKYQCKIRILDSFGTEPDFNHVSWAKGHNLSSPYGGLNLIPLQFYTMFPHTPDNTFLGFVVQPHWSDEENKKLESIKRKNQALVYGKRASFWKGKTAYLDTIHKYLDLHGTVDNGALIPSYVTNHGIVKGAEVHALLRESKVFVGLSFPFEGPAPLEALANGCVFLNPRLNPPQSRLNSEFFKEKPNIREVTSQHPYAEAIGEPYVWMVDMDNSTDVERAVKAIINQTIEPYIPYEFTCEGMLQRVNILIEKQDFCNSTTSWPPLSTLQVVTAEVGASCKDTCQKQGLICEPAFFPHLNSAQSLANYGINCQTTEHSGGYLVLPAYDNNSKHCVFQSDPLLFSCVRSHLSWTRVCPCRDYIKDQIALCKACL